MKKAKDILIKVAIAATTPIATLILSIFAVPVRIAL